MYHSGLRHAGDAKGGFGSNTDMTPILWQPLYPAIYQSATCVADPNLIARRMITYAVASFHHNSIFLLFRCLRPLFPSSESLAARCNRPKGFDLAITDTDIPIMNITGGITMTWHQL